MWIYRRPLNSSKDHVTFLGGQKMCRKKPQKTAWIILESHGQDPIHGLQEKVSVSAWPKKEAKEFQPRVENPRFFGAPSIGLIYFWGKFWLHHWVVAEDPPSKKPWKLMGWKTIPFLLGRYILGGRTVSFRRCVRKPNHWEFHGIPSKCFPSQDAIVTTTMTNYIFSRDAVLGLGEHSSISYLHFWI